MTAWRAWAAEARASVNIPWSHRPSRRGLPLFGPSPASSKVSSSARQVMCEVWAWQGVAMVRDGRSKHCRSKHSRSKHRRSKHSHSIACAPVKMRSLRTTSHSTDEAPPPGETAAPRT